MSGLLSLVLAFLLIFLLSLKSQQGRRSKADVRWRRREKRDAQARLLLPHRCPPPHRLKQSTIVSQPLFSLRIDSLPFLDALPTSDMDPTRRMGIYSEADAGRRSESRFFRVTNRHLPSPRCIAKMPESNLR